jgi:hypothetical protein
MGFASLGESSFSPEIPKDLSSHGLFDQQAEAG